MTETTTTEIGLDYIIVHSCGCITAWMMGDGGHSTPKDIGNFYRGAAERGAEVRRVELTDELRADPNFFPMECPHTPVGWTRQEPKEPDPIRYRRVQGRGVSRVEVRIKGWEHGGFPAGEVAKREGKWWATEGWFDYNKLPEAHAGEKPVPVLGPFDKQREAAEALLPLAEKRGAALRKEWDRNV